MFTQAPRQLFTADAKFAAVKGTNGKPGTLRGYALVWNVLSTDRGGYAVRLLPKSATFAAPTFALYHHSTIGGPLGDTASGTLRILPADDFGQPVEIDLPDTQLGRDVFELVSTGRVRGMSFGMASIPEGKEVRENGRDIFEASAYAVDEVTITHAPAFAETAIGVKPKGNGQAAADYTARRNDALRFEAARFSTLTLPPAAA